MHNLEAILTKFDARSHGMQSTWEASVGHFAYAEIRSFLCFSNAVDQSHQTKVNRTGCMPISWHAVSTVMSL